MSGLFFWHPKNSRFDVWPFTLIDYPQPEIPKVAQAAIEVKRECITEVYSQPLILLEQLERCLVHPGGVVCFAVLIVVARVAFFKWDVGMTILVLACN